VSASSSAQRLLLQIAGAEPAHLREELAAALRSGAIVHPWSTVPASHAEQDVRLHEIVEGRPEAEAALAAPGKNVGIAEVALETSRLVAILPDGARPAVARSTVERCAAPFPPDWSFESARGPAAFAAAESPDGVEHALGNAGATLCGLARRNVEVYRHLFRPGQPGSCPRCGDLSADAPSEPTTQERLHSLITAAAPGPLRDELAAALERGAEITLWMDGPASGFIKHYGRLERLTEGREAVVAALQSDERAGLAHVLYGDWRSTIVLRNGQPPVIARAFVGWPQ
jgi:hypothetical protein